MAIKNEKIYGPKGRRTWTEAEKDKYESLTKPGKMPKDQAEKPVKPAKPRKPRKPKDEQKEPVPSPYDTPYLNRRQFRREQIQRATDAVEPISAIESRANRERAGATAVTQSFQDMLARQSAQNTAAMNAIQQASGGAGSALVTGAVTGEQQRAAAIPLYSAGIGNELQRDIAQREADARKERSQSFRDYLYKSGADIRDEEREKAATRIETAAAEKAYGLDLAKYNRDIMESDRNYDLASARVQAMFDRSAASDEKSIISLIDNAAKAALKGSGGKKGTGKWSGSISFMDSNRETVTIPVKNPVNLPKNNSTAARDKFWADYVKRMTGKVPVGKVNRSGVAEVTKTGGGSTDAAAQAVADGLLSKGYTPEEAYALILRSSFGIANAAAVRRALGV